MSLFKAPIAIISEIEKIQNRFLWEGVSEVKRPHLVRWAMVKAPRSRGGLGVIDLRCLNVALLGKWGWRFATERNAWWRGLIVDKCGIGRYEWKPVWNLQGAGWSVWRDIVKIIPEFWNFATIDPGGGGLSFWFDSWVMGECLALRYPRIVAAAQSTDVFLFDSVAVSDRLIWSIPLSTELRGGAEDERLSMMVFLHEVPVERISRGPPFPLWDHEASGVFSVKSFFRILRQQRFTGCSDFPFSLVWLGDIPTKISGFLWLVYHKCISTFDNLQKRGFIGPNVCVLCRADLESVPHLFLTCPFSVQVWITLSSKLSIWGPNLRDIRGFIQEWKSRNLSSSWKMYRDRLVHAFFWSIWLERNNRIFRDSERSIGQVAWKVIWSVGRWLRVAGFISEVQLRGWLTMWMTVFYPG
ncbi:Putative ribonuclease H protein At1g65750 [Linum perenne]